MARDLGWEGVGGCWWLLHFALSLYRYVPITVANCYTHFSSVSGPIFKAFAKQFCIQQNPHCFANSDCASLCPVGINSVKIQLANFNIRSHQLFYQLGPTVAQRATTTAFTLSWHTSAFSKSALKRANFALYWKNSPGMVLFQKYLLAASMFPLAHLRLKLHT